jgi:hypothetical protein
VGCGLFGLIFFGSNYPRLYVKYHHLCLSVFITIFSLVYSAIIINLSIYTETSLSVILLSTVVVIGLVFGMAALPAVILVRCRNTNQFGDFNICCDVAGC